ncbi:CCR4-NOT transcription complex subunit 1 [Protopterus annectens]|uniref:CCR4-NOT transcription complex subunit 1 n=1 Tax=Protopterus annectens TaxID=7888 RepID=UPI001CFC0BBE|nr:CCR4-NOT transcription complex subunit 1 [Protopterus annectens]
MTLLKIFIPEGVDHQQGKLTVVKEFLVSPSRDGQQIRIPGGDLLVEAGLMVNAQLLIVNQHGPEADRHLLRCLFSHVDFSGDGKSSGKDFHQTQFLIQECASLITKPNFVSTLCYAVDNPLHYQKSLKPSPHLFAQLSKVLKLSKVQEVIFGLALLNSSISDLRGFAAQFVKQKLPDLLRSYIDADVSGSQEGGFQDIAIEVLHLLLSHLLFGQKGAFGVGQEQIDAFLKTLRRDFPQERCPVVLAPLLYPLKRDILMERILPDSGGIAKTMMDSSLADFMQEVGYGFCASVEECRNIIIQFGVREVTAAQVARVLGRMARTHSGLPDGIALQSISTHNTGLWSEGKDKSDGAQAHTWNVEVLIDVVKELNPNLNFKEVTYELDNPGFQILDSKGLQIVVYGIQRGLGMDVFPVDLIYRPWKHAEGQLSFIQHSLLNPDIFCFADYPCHTVNTDILKAPPEDDNREIATWKSLDLIESLLRLAEVGQYDNVKQLFNFPIKHCPDMLVLALLQINTSWHTLRQELISTLMPIFLGNHPNSAIILHYAWHGQGQSPSIRQLIMHAMAEWYMRGEQYDQAKLSRILDVAQDLKALSMLLNGTPFAFVIDLAALASRREYLKLDKWLTDKIREHGEPFIQACVTFLKRRCPSIMGGLATDKDQPKSSQLPPETLATMLACLQACAGSVSQEVSETILTMVANCSNVMNKARQPPPGVMPKGRPPSTSSLDAISPVQIQTGHLLRYEFRGLLSKLEKSGLGTSSLTSMATGGLGLPAVNSDAFGQRKISTSALNPPTFQQSKMKTSDLSQVWPEANQHFTKEIDDEANSYFQRIYNHPPHPTMSVDEVLEMLQRFKDSSIKREREVFNCMLRNLFEEYRFFPQYPDKELHITACLFGGIIEKGLVTYMALGLALRYVLEALRKPYTSKMYYFGIAALDRFKNRLKDYPQYCSHLASIPHFLQFPHHLQEVSYFTIFFSDPNRANVERSTEFRFQKSTFQPPMNKYVATFQQAVLRDLHFPPFESQILQENINSTEKKALMELKENNKIVILQADKGGAVVILDMDYYIQEGLPQLSDTRCYMSMGIDPTPKFKKEIDAFIDRAVEEGIISRSIAQHLTVTDPSKQILYLLPKIHKSLTSLPGRPIVSGHGSLMEPLLAFLTQQLKPLLKYVRARIQDTTQFLQIIQDTQIESQWLLCTLDVRSLYTSIPHWAGLQALQFWLEKADLYPPGFNTLIICMSEHVLNKNILYFQGECYWQLQGAAMGASFAPIYADLFMAYLEECLIYNPSHNIYMVEMDIWRRYLDDCWMVWHADSGYLHEFMEYLSSNIWGIEFTVTSNLNQIDFLEVTVYRNTDNTLGTKIHCKYPQYNTLLHASSTVRNIPKSQFLRIKRISSSARDYQDATIDLTNRFLERGYRPLDILSARNWSGQQQRSQLLEYRDHSPTMHDYTLRFVTTYGRNHQVPTYFLAPVFKKVAEDMYSCSLDLICLTVMYMAVTSITESIFNFQPSINTTNIDTLLVATDQTERIVEPPENIQEKIAFIFNNLSQSNMTQKVEELKETVKEEFMPWVSQYLVMKRVSIEPNFHSLYSNFLDTLKNSDFNKMVLAETYRNIKVLLTSDKAAANFSDRSLLKNLGHWLGMITLAKNKPILHTDLDVKSLLLEAYVKGQQELLYVVPFVAKVLESSIRSMVFRPPNPWTMAIMNVLAELHLENDLKLNLKFEIEVLCKNLSLDINELKPGNLLKDKEKLKHLDEQLSAPKKDIKPPPEEMPAVTTAARRPTTQILHSQKEEVFILVPQEWAEPQQIRVSSVTPASTTTCTTSGPPQPQFSYHDINVYSLAGLAPHVTINTTIPLFQAHPQLKQCVRQAIERAVQELVHPVVDRSIKIAMTTCEQIVRKDFALDSEESRMRVAAHHMMRNLTAGMAMITCREPLLMSIATNLKNSFASALRTASPQQRELMETAAGQIAQDNCELACCFIQKTAVEKAGPEMDKRLATEFELRKHARQEGRRYCDPVVLTYQAERMPEQIRLKVGGVDPKQLAVYEEFARNVPGFLPSNDTSQPTGFLAQPMKQAWATDDVAQIYDKCIADLEQHMHAIPPTLAMNPQAQALRNLLEAVVMARNSRDAIAALGLLQKAVEGLLDATSGADADLLLRYRECHLLVLKALQDGRAYGAQWCNKQITRCLIECRDEYKYNVEAVELLIRNHLVNMPQYDLHLAQSMENGLNYMAVAFAMQLVKMLLVDERSVGQITEADLFHTIETLMRINAHSRGNAPEGLPQLMEVVRSNYEAMIDRVHGGPNFMMHSGISQASEYDDPPGLREKAEYLLREWVNLYHSAAAGRDSTKAFSAFVGQMHQQGILKTDDLITRFFRLCTEMCVEISYRAHSDQHNPGANPTMIRAKCYHNLDAFVRLIALLVKHSGEATNTVTKINLLNKVLGIVVGVLLQDHDGRQCHSDFQQLPYHRIFIMLLLELNAPEHVLETINFQTLTAFCNTFHILRPTKAPGFVYAWLELISHRIFIARMLAHTPQQKGWPMYAQLLIDLFKYLAPFLRNVELSKPMQILYKGIIDYLSTTVLYTTVYIASSRLQVDMLSEINIAPRILTNFTGVMPPQFKKDLDSYLKTRSPVTFLSELRSNLQVSNEPGNRYNIQLINALVLYVGTQAIAHIHNKGSTPSMSTITHSAHMDIFQNLAVDLDTEGRYLFLNAIANQLRYPNSHTHYFSCTMLYLFAEANTEAIQEQITRVLLERLIVNRPHPWGLLITFIELIKNPAFKFWNHEFVHCAPEIEKLFQSVAQCCMGPKQAQQVMEGTGAS